MILEDNMKIAIIHNSKPITSVLAIVCASFGGHKIVDATLADLVIAEAPADLLRHLKAGRLVIQFVASKTDCVAEGLRTAPDFADRFRVFQVVEFFPGIPTAVEMYAYLGSLATKEVR
jgi:hypothetical protein